ncbi:hypothetical protein ACIRFH_10505 [Streptomyces sp. NPDC093586]|uniref:hypothetical protein n=1 Tax=Streptomyces sp. NPDC093586 TaxID=3366042 RepID=UPI00381C1F95
MIHLAPGGDVLAGAARLSYRRIVPYGIVTACLWATAEAVWGMPPRPLFGAS